jgi:hypothetical protein
MSLSSSSVAPTPDVTVIPTVPGQMPNQARTLLLNLDGSTRPDPTFYGEEYVPPYFRPVELTSGLLNARRAIFGSNPDNAGMNYMVWQYMRLLHSTEFEEYITALDSRITYLTSASLVDYPYGEVITPDDNALQFVGDPGLGGADGKLMTSWEISFAGSSVTIKNLQSFHSTSTPVTVVDGLTDFVPMTDYKTLKVRINLAIGNSKWIVSYLSSPGAPMDPINRATQLANIGTESYVELFPYSDPYNLFRKLWEDHSEFSYKMSGALLSLIYRTNDLRVNGD